MRFVSARDFTAERPWGATAIVEIPSATVRLHWTDRPYLWHVNDGPEVFVVLDGVVDMHYQVDGAVRVQRLAVGDICHVESGDLHVAHPAPEARILVIERTGSL